MSTPSPKLLVLSLVGLLAACGPTTPGGGGGGNNQVGGDGCVQITGDITTDTTLKAGCYDLTTAINVTAALTLQPGVEINAAAGTGINITTGTLTATGTAANPIVMKGSGTQGAWAGLFIGSANANSLDYVTLTDGGRAGDEGGLRIWQGAKASVKHTTVQNSASSGMFVDPEAVLTGFADNTFTGNALYPAYVAAENLGMLDAASHYTGNGTDEVRTLDAFTAKATVHDIGVPYRIKDGDNVYVNAPVTIEPGVTFDMGKGAWIGVQNASDSGAATDGSLKAVGTPKKMITFHGDGTPGYWYQLQFGSASPDNVLSYVKVVDAGQDPTNTQSAITLMAGTDSVTVNHSIIGNNKGYAFCDPNGSAGDQGFHLDSPDSNTYSPPNGNSKFCP